MRAADGGDRVIQATDLTPIQNLAEGDHQWLADLAKTTDATALTLRIGGLAQDDPEPVVFYDERMGRWWAGRYIGEVRYAGRSLRILPRFGMPRLERWLSRIWGVRLFTSKGRYETSTLWLWELIARLWASRLLRAAKHGLPTVRLEEVHRGTSTSGRLEISRTAWELSIGSGHLVSRTRNRRLDNRIGGVVLQAFEQLHRELGNAGVQRHWLTDRGLNLVAELRKGISRREAVAAAQSRLPIRYTPITENYRPVVQLSLAIARRRPFLSSSIGQNDVFGVLIDMAEVWELYVYHVLRSGLTPFDVVHTGRTRDPLAFLLRSASGEQLGGLKPDILIRSPRFRHVLAVLDAKYKSTVPSPDRPSGIHREDLYQMTAYLSAFGDRAEAVTGGLIYPVTDDTAHLLDLQRANPWTMLMVNRWMCLFGLSCAGQECSDLEFKTAEEALSSAIAQALEQRPILSSSRA